MSCNNVPRNTRIELMLKDADGEYTVRLGELEFTELWDFNEAHIDLDASVVAGLIHTAITRRKE